MPPSLLAIAKKAQEKKELRFFNLYRLIDENLLQLAVTRILEAIYEQDFLRCSYGYRPKKGALDAVDKLTVKFQFGRYNFVVEADIQGFLDHASYCPPVHEVC